MSQHFDKWDLCLMGFCLMLLALYVLHVVSKAVINHHSRNMRRWFRGGR